MVVRLDQLKEHRSVESLQSVYTRGEGWVLRKLPGHELEGTVELQPILLDAIRAEAPANNTRAERLLRFWRRQKAGSDSFRK